jgi:transcriptional regulator with XRE-family HTH domain
MRRRRRFDLYLEDQLKDPHLGKKPRKAGKAWDVALQLASLRKKSGMSQKELARRLRTSQQQISRLESPSYEGHSLSMLRRVADVLGATVHVEIHGKKQPTVVAEAIPIYRVEGNTVVKRNGLRKFEMDFLREGKIDVARNFRIAEALYKEAVTLGIIPLENPLDGIEVDIKIAKVVNSV